MKVVLYFAEVLSWHFCILPKHGRPGVDCFPQCIVVQRFSLLREGWGEVGGGLTLVKRGGPSTFSGNGYKPSPPQSVQRVPTNCTIKIVMYEKTFSLQSIQRVPKNCKVHYQEWWALKPFSLLSVQRVPVYKRPPRGYNRSPRRTICPKAQRPAS